MAVALVPASGAGRVVLATRQLQWFGRPCSGASPYLYATSADLQKPPG